MATRCSHRNPHTRQAFTLVELMIVVALLGILAALVVPRFGSASDQARVSGIERQLQTVRGQIEYYLSREGQYPPGLVAGTGWDDLVDLGYLVKAPMNQMRSNLLTIATGDTRSPGETIPGGAAWYWDTTMNRLYAADRDGLIYDY